MAAPPLRPPQNLLTVISSRVSGRDVVDLRPTLDSTSCLSHRSGSLVALMNTANESSCQDFETFVHKAGGHQFSVMCGHDYHRSVPDGDVYLWWQQTKFWINGAALALLQSQVVAGKIRASAEALIMFDMTSWRDAGDWQHMRPRVTWWHQVSFDEREQCKANLAERHHTLCSSGRACGQWIVAAFPLNASQREPEVPPGVDFRSIKYVEGHEDAPISCAY